jgi:hypothetical protein
MSNTDGAYPDFSTLNARHHRLGAWFLGPKAENAQFLKDFFQYIAEQTESARKTFQPNDPVSRSFTYLWSFLYLLPLLLRITNYATAWEIVYFTLPASFFIYR